MPNTQQPSTHDCENNIESNMTAPHCRVCDKPLHSEVESLMNELEKEFEFKAGDDWFLLKEMVDDILLAQKKQIEERIEKVPVSKGVWNFPIDSARADMKNEILAAVKEVLSE